MPKKKYLCFFCVGLFVFIAITYHSHCSAQNLIDPKISAVILNAQKNFLPENQLLLGLQITIEKNWHIYWKNPGESGMPTRIQVVLPKGLPEAEILWPFPKAFDDNGIKSMGYADQVTWPIVITVPKSFNDKQIEMVAHIEWLACNDICIPGDKKLKIKLTKATSGTVEINPNDQSKIQKALEFVPKEIPSNSAQAHFAANQIQLMIKPLTPLGGSGNIQLFPVTTNFITLGEIPAVIANGKELSFKLTPVSAKPNPEQKSFAGVLVNDGGWKEFPGKSVHFQVPIQYQTK